MKFQTPFAFTARRFLLPIVALGLALNVHFAFVASAQLPLTTSLSATAPTTNVQISNTAAPGNNGPGQVPGNDIVEGDTYGRSDKGQTFTVGATGFSVGAFTLQVAAVQAAAPGASFTLTLYSYANSATATPSGTVATYVGNLPTSLVSDPSGTSYYASNPTFLSFNVPATVLSANGVYGFNMSFTNQGTANQDINFFISYGNSYNGGIGTSFNGSSFAGSNNDFTDFYISSVPEPSHYVMGSASLVAYAIAYRRRRRLI